MSQLVKQDLNFLEYPLWIQQERSPDGLIWEDIKGYVYKTSYKPPTKTDILFLYYFLLQSQKDSWTEQLEFAQREVLRGCGLKAGKNYRLRLQDSLKRWSSVTVDFQGTFYDGHDYLFMQFHIIDHWKIDKKTRKLKIRFSPEWLLHVEKSHFYKYINFGQLKKLRSPLAIRLYEVLVKSFQGRIKWEIGALKLATKITMKEKHPAHIIPKIKAAVNRINEHTELCYSLEVRRPERGKAIFVFHKEGENRSNPQSARLPQILDLGEGQKESLEKLLELISEEHRKKKTVVEMVSGTLRKHDEEYVKRNIELANEKAKTNYRGYLWKALQNDYAAENNFKSKAQKQASGEQLKVPQKEELKEVPLPTLSEILKVAPDKVWNFEELIALVGKKWREDERVVELLLDAFEEEKAEYIIWNILNANKNAGRDYAVQLKHSLKDNYGAHYREQLGKEILSSTSQS